MLSERLPEIGEAIDVEVLDRLGDLAVQAPAAPRWELAVGELADPIVGEVKTVSCRSQEMPSNEFFHALRRRVLPEAGGAVQEVELELAPDHRGHAQQRAAPLRQSFEATPDDLANALRQCQGISGAILQRTHRLNDHERIAFGGDPNPLGQWLGRRRLPSR